MHSKGHFLNYVDAEKYSGGSNQYFEQTYSSFIEYIKNKSINWYKMTTIDHLMSYYLSKKFKTNTYDT